MFSKRANPIPSLGSVQNLDALFDLDVLVLFKHSPRCGVSLSAYREVARLEKARPATTVPMVSVRSERALSNYVAERTCVPHESPQVIILRAGEVVAVISHWQIDCEALADLL